jgi:hypothetical protein
LLVDQVIAREVEQHRIRAKQRDPRGVYQLLGRIGQRHVQRHVVALGQQPVDAVHPVYLGGYLRGVLCRDRRVIPEHAHAEVDRGVRDSVADRSQPDHAKRAARELDW